MNKPEWTAGPWHVESPEDYTGYLYVCHADTECDETVVAKVPADYAASNEWAHLIAAAPDMAEALRMFVREAEPRDLLRPEVARARRALEQAGYRP